MRTSAKLPDLIAKARALFENEGLEWAVHDSKETFATVDRYLAGNHSDLEKAFFILLHRFPGWHSSYFLIPNEVVRVRNCFDMWGISQKSKQQLLHITYEIDFAIYAGSLEKPVKIAIECDGIRSHTPSNSRKDRRKDVNLQAAGWLVVHFSSQDIHDELDAVCTNRSDSWLRFTIAEIVSSGGRLLTGDAYNNHRIRSMLTGVPYEPATCTCGHSQVVRRDIKVMCSACGIPFERPHL